MSEPSGSSNGQAIIFRARVEQVGVLGNFVIKAVIAVYGVALVALLGSSMA